MLKELYQQIRENVYRHPVVYEIMGSVMAMGLATVLALSGKNEPLEAKVKPPISPPAAPKSRNEPLEARAKPPIQSPVPKPRAPQQTSQQPSYLDELEDGETDVLADGTQIGIRDIPYGGGRK
jgi:hypothetical protein